MPKKPPRLQGSALTAARIAAETQGTDIAIREVLKRGLGIDALARLPDTYRADLPLDARPLQARAPRPHASHPKDADASQAPAASRTAPRTTAAMTAAFRDRATTPRDVAARALAEGSLLSSRRPTMNILAASDAARTQREAEASTARYAAGTPIGPLDGVPFLVKDEYDVVGLPTRLGSLCSPITPKEHDSTLVARLCRAGAVFAGKTVMTEWGLSPIGANRSSVMPHNPYNPMRAPGGSSTGSAVGVALGIAPIAAGADGGGSIRTPAAFCGVFGLKPTFARVTRAGYGFGGSVTHTGPIALCPADIAAFLDAVASEPDPDDPITAWAPPPPAGGFGALLGAGVRGLRIGVPEGEWRDASDAVARAGQEALRALEREGAELVAVEMPIARYAAPIGYLTIGLEALVGHRTEWLTQRSAINDDVRLSFAALSGISALEQLDAQRLRAGMRREAAAVLRRVDVLALPVSAIEAPRYSGEDAQRSFSDPAALDGLCRFAFLGNLTGLPGGSAPVGVDAEGVPIGLQILGDAWDEATVLAVMAHMERAGISALRRPPGAVDLY